MTLDITLVEVDFHDRQSIVDVGRRLDGR